MFWRVASLATTSPVELILDRESYTLEELLEEDDLIQECKSLNQRLINFLKGRDQVTKLLRYVIEEPSSSSDDRHYFKYPFVACEVLSCEIDQIFNTIFDDSSITDLLFSFVDPDKPHPNPQAGYFSKIVICLLVRRNNEVMSYLQSHQDILWKLVNLVGITSIMEVLMKLVGADEQILMYHSESLKWLVETNLLEMLVDRLSPQYTRDEQANAAETLTAVTKTAPTALSTQLASPKYFNKLFQLILESPQSKSGIVHSLSVCISLLEPRKAHPMAPLSMRNMIPAVQPADPEIVAGVLSRIGDVLALVDISKDETVFPTTYGQLNPPFGLHRLKIVEFLATFFRNNVSRSSREFIRLGVISTLIDLLFRFPFNNCLHHQVESLINSGLESNDYDLILYIVKDCDLVNKILNADANPIAPQTGSGSRGGARVGYIGHLTRVANKLVHLTGNKGVSVLMENVRWKAWLQEVLEKRNAVENIYGWKCGRPTRVGERMSDFDDGYNSSRDYDISGNSLNYRYANSEDTETDLESISKGMVQLQIIPDKDSDSDEEDQVGDTPSTSALKEPDQIPDSNTSDSLEAERNVLALPQVAWTPFPESNSPPKISVPLLKPPPGPSFSHPVVVGFGGESLPSPGSMADAFSDPDDEANRPTFKFSFLQRYIDSPSSIAELTDSRDALVPAINFVPNASASYLVERDTLPKAPVGSIPASSPGPAATPPPTPVAPTQVEDDDDFDVRGGGGALSPGKPHVPLAVDPTLSPVPVRSPSPTHDSPKRLSGLLNISKPQAVIYGFGNDATSGEGASNKADTPRPLVEDELELRTLGVGPEAMEGMPRWIAFPDASPLSPSALSRITEPASVSSSSAQSSAEAGKAEVSPAVLNEVESSRSDS